MIHLRYYHRAGGSKDWFAEIRPDGLVIRFGRTDARTLQERFIPAARCHPDPTGEARSRATRKMKKGYMLVREQPSLAGVAPPPPEEPVRTDEKPSAGVSSVIKEWGRDHSDNWF
jgi:hypothetical protein